jgi:hypothetical protein
MKAYRYLVSHGAGFKINYVSNVKTCGYTVCRYLIRTRARLNVDLTIILIITPGFSRNCTRVFLVRIWRIFSVPHNTVILSILCAQGASSTEYGLVFGVFELVVFLTSPIFGHLLPRLGVTQAFTFGIGATGCMCITFGCLNFIQVGIRLRK